MRDAVGFLDLMGLQLAYALRCGVCVCVCVYVHVYVCVYLCDCICVCVWFVCMCEHIDTPK